MIGREGELAMLELLLARAAQQRRAAIATVVGAPGIGKSRLAEEVARSVDARGLAHVVRGRAFRSARD